MSHRNVPLNLFPGRDEPRISWPFRSSGISPVRTPMAGTSTDHRTLLHPAAASVAAKIQPMVA